MSMGWFLPSISNGGSLAGLRRGFGGVCGQLQVLEVFASPLELPEGSDHVGPGGQCEGVFCAN